MDISFVTDTFLNNTEQNIVKVVFISQEYYATLSENEQSKLKNLGFQGEYKDNLILISENMKNKTLMIGLGQEAKLLEQGILNIAGYTISLLKKDKQVYLTYQVVGFNLPSLIANLILGMKLKSWSFDKYITDVKRKNTLQTINLFVNLPQDIKEKDIDLTAIEAVYEGVSLAKDLINEPANILYPATYIEIIKELQNHNIKVTILDESAIKKLKMGAFLSVALGSNTKPYLAIMEYNGNPTQKQPYAFVGKGVTFDSGGYSLKPPMAMFDMKKDMSGSATVVGLLKTLALRQAKVKVVGVVGLVENMLNGESTKPGDIVTSMSGKTIERLNTDAEGRLVLADLLWYTQAYYKPQFMINIATLTGAIIVALGTERAGLFSNSKDLIHSLLDSGEKTGELLWHMPLGDEYKAKLKSSIADLQDVSLTPKVAGSVYAALFLKEFINNVPWAHLDIAGIGSLATQSDLSQTGSTGFGVRLLNNFIKKYEE